jgi:hypothetical protein
MIFEKLAVSNQQPAISSQQSAVSNQQPAISSQQSAKAGSYANLDRSTPGCLTPASENRACLIG